MRVLGAGWAPSPLLPPQAPRMRPARSAGSSFASLAFMTFLPLSVAVALVRSWRGAPDSAPCRGDHPRVFLEQPGHVRYLPLELGDLHALLLEPLRFEYSWDLSFFSKSGSQRASLGIPVALVVERVQPPRTNIVRGEGGLAGNTRYCLYV